MTREETAAVWPRLLRARLCVCVCVRVGTQQSNSWFGLCPQGAAQRPRVRLVERNKIAASLSTHTRAAGTAGKGRHRFRTASAREAQHTQQRLVVDRQSSRAGRGEKRSESRGLKAGGSAPSSGVRKIRSTRPSFDISDRTWTGWGNHSQ